MSFIPPKQQITAVGVAFKKENDLLKVALICGGGKQKRWQLPKGIIDKGETPEVAVVREVREEAGNETELLELIERVEYWYVAPEKSGKVGCHKFVYFFLMRFKSGDVEDYDHEVLEARWFYINDAIENIAFKSERGVLEKAKEMIEKL